MRSVFIIENPAQPCASTRLQMELVGLGECSRDGITLRCFIEFLGDADGREADLYVAEASFKYSSGLRIPFRCTLTAEAAFRSPSKRCQALHSGDPYGRGRPGDHEPGNQGEP